MADDTVTGNKKLELKVELGHSLQVTSHINPRFLARVEFLKVLYSLPKLWSKC